MKEIEDRAEHNSREQRRFLYDAREDGLKVTLYVSTLDGGTLGSTEGLTWGVMQIDPLRCRFRGPASLYLPDLDAVLRLDRIFALQCDAPEGRRTLVVLDTPAQQTSAAEMFNNPGVRELVGITGPTYQVHEAHRASLPAIRRRGFRVLPGGAS